MRRFVYIPSNYRFRARIFDTQSTIRQNNYYVCWELSEVPLGNMDQVGKWYKNVLPVDFYEERFKDNVELSADTFEELMFLINL